jgi:dipeptide/tripeptide permease
MKYIITIFIGAIIIGGLLAVGTYFLFGANPGYFFAKFVAAPVGLIGSIVLFVVYDTLWPKKPSKSTKVYSSHNSDNET